MPTILIRMLIRILFSSISADARDKQKKKAEEEKRKRNGMFESIRDGRKEKEPEQLTMSEIMEHEDTHMRGGMK